MKLITDTPIKNLRQAKRYFLLMGCNHYHIAGESFKRRDEYYSLKISSEREEKWRNQDIKRRIRVFPYNKPKVIAWSYFDLSQLINDLSGGYKKMLNIAKRVYKKVPLDEIYVMLNSIVGNNGLITHGGLIEESYLNGHKDIAQQFLEIAEKMIIRAINEQYQLNFLQGYFVDVAESFKLNIDPQKLNQYRRNDNKTGFEYYLNGANEGNGFSMYQLGIYYSKGRGCEKDIDRAIFWLKKAKANGNKYAEEELKKLERSSDENKECK